MRVTLAFALCGLCACSEDGHDHGHESGDGEFEWAGIFEVPEDLYMWTAQKVDGEYGHGDTTMKMAVLKANAATAAELERLEPEGKHSLEMNCTEVDTNGVITPMEDACYELHFETSLWQSLYRIDTSSATNVVIFAQHVPTEFENTAHYLKDSVGEDIEPMAEHPEVVETAHDDHAEWGPSILAAIIVNIATLIGVIFSVPVCARVAEAHAAVFEGVQCMFAAGALIACAVFLLLFEATHLVGEGWTSEVDIVWRWGTMILVGFFFPLVFDGITALITESGQDAQNDQLAEGGAPRSRVRIMSAVTIGDFLHNLCDGFFIGAAFKGCGTSFGWGVSLATVLHELPQELADYGILTGKSVGMRPWRALLLNFLAGLSVIIGVLIINAADVENSAVGLLLSFGGGVYMYVAAVECMPRVHQLQLSPKIYMLCMFCFIVGAVLIGLILLDHEHCIPEGAEGDGHGHGHGHGH